MSPYCPESPIRLLLHCGLSTPRVRARCTGGFPQTFIKFCRCGALSEAHKTHLFILKWRATSEVSKCHMLSTNTFYNQRHWAPVSPVSLLVHIGFCIPKSMEMQNSHERGQLHLSMNLEWSQKGLNQSQSDATTSPKLFDTGPSTYGQHEGLLMITLNRYLKLPASDSGKYLYQNQYHY